MRTRRGIFGALAALLGAGPAAAAAVVGGEAGILPANPPLLTLPANWTYEVDERGRRVWILRAPDGAVVITYRPEGV